MAQRKVKGDMKAVKLHVRQGKQARSGRPDTRTVLCCLSNIDIVTELRGGEQYKNRNKLRPIDERRGEKSRNSLARTAF